MFYKVKQVQPLSDYRLLVDFVTGERKQYDVKPLFNKWEAFGALASRRGLFEKVRVDIGGYGIVWNAELDLAADELWHNGAAL